MAEASQAPAMVALDGRLDGGAEQRVSTGDRCGRHAGGVPRARPVITAQRSASVINCVIASDP